MNAASQLLTMPEAARMLKLGQSTVEKLTSKKQIPHVKFGRSVRYDAADLRAWIESKKVPSCAGAPA
jgi:excisionase family DNA binding protein